MSERNAEVSLSDLQLAVMRVLWQRGAASTTEVAEGLAGERDLAHTTVATLLSRLEKRRLVSSKRDGRQLVYRARVTQNVVRRSMVSGLLANLFAGDAKALLAHLVREDEFDSGDLDQVKALLGEAGDHE